jgi:hypothetical protein
MVRRTLAIGAGLLVLILLVLAFRGCLNARGERAIKDYVGNSSELINQSKLEGNQLFGLLGGSGSQNDAVDAANVVNGLRSESATLVDRAQDLDAPDEVSTAQASLLDALELRRDALAAVANALPGALADEERRESTSDIAEMMQVFLASDVLLKYRFKPSLEQTLRDEDLEGEVTVPSQRRLEFVPDVQWVPTSWPTRSPACAARAAAPPTSPPRPACMETASARSRSAGSRSCRARPQRCHSPTTSRSTFRW